MELKSKFELREVVYHPFKTEIETLIIDKVMSHASNLNGADMFHVSYDVLNQKDGSTGYKGIHEESLFRSKKSAARKVLENMGMIVGEKDMKEAE